MTLPKGWIELALGEVGRWGSGGTPKASEQSYYGGDIPWIRSGDLPDGPIESHEIQISSAGLENSSAKWVGKGAVLVAMYGATIGKLGVTTYPITTNQAVAFVEPYEGIDTQYLFENLRLRKADLVSLGQGGAQPNISQEIIKAQNLLLPPAAEQRRIVAKLDTLTARIARARAELDRVPVLAERLRAATLRDAVEGALTLTSSRENWNESQRNQLSHRRLAYLKARRGSRISKEVSADIHHLNGARLGWLDCNLADVVELRVGYAFKSSDFSDTGARLLRGANVAPGRVNWDDAVSLPRNLSDQYQKYILDAGDIVIAMDRPLISSGLKIARLSDTDAGSLLVQRVANPRATEWIAQEYLYLVLRSHLFRQQIEDHATGSDLPHISANDILTTRCPLPPIDIQIEIARAANAALSRADRLEAEAARARALLNRLESSILAKAFRGELVPQDDGDEPASVLLERIRTQRAAAPKKMRAARRAGVGG